MREIILETSKTTTNNNILQFQPEKLKFYGLLSVVILTVLCFFHILSLYFVTFDENLEIISNFMNNLNWERFQKLYANQNNFNNYLGYLLLKKEFQWYVLAPKGYHFISYLLHILNVALVFYAVWLLTNRNIIAIVAALLFALHPVHAETVTAILAQGELLMSFFALLSIICYVNYITPQKISQLTTKLTSPKYLYLSLLFFVLALATKFTAVALPLVFILIDYVKLRKDTKIWTEKAVFWIIMLIGIALFMYLQAAPAQKTFFAVPDYNIFDRLILAFYTIGVYLKNCLIPFGLSPFYPYPEKTDIFLTWTCYVMATIPFIAGFAVWKLKNHVWLVFGFLFLLANLVLISNILPLGNRTFASDSHSYFASLGIFIAIGYGIDYLLAAKPKFSLHIYVGLAIVILGFYVMTFFATKAYETGINLWTRIVETNPVHYYPRLKRGEIRTMNEDTYREGMMDLNKSVEIMPNDAETWNSKGVMHLHIGDYHGADSIFNEALKRNPKLAVAYFHKGHIDKTDEKYGEALENYNKAIECNPNYAAAYLNRGSVLYQMKQYEMAVANYSKAIQLNPNYVEAYQNRGNIYFAIQAKEQAMKDYNKALQLNPQNPEVLFYRGLLRNVLGDKTNACMDLNAAKELGKKEAPQAIKEICR